MLVEGKGFAFYVEFEYENVPDFCVNCKTIGHHIDFCKKMHYDEEIRPKALKRKLVVEPKKVFVPTKDGRVEQNKSKATIDVDRVVVNVENTTVDNIRENSEAEIAKKRYQVKGKATVASVSSSDRLRQKAKKLEDDLDAQIKADAARDSTKEVHDDVSSQGSFVDATQIQEDSNDETEDDIEISTPDRIKKDMVFLHNSWANLADLEEEEDGLTASTHNEDQQNVDADGFKMKLSKNQKKAQKKQVSRDTYATRSKVNPRPSP